MYSVDRNLEAECIRLRSLAAQLELLGAGCLPMPTAIIDQWEVATSLAPCLVGKAVRHPKLPAGRTIVTSQLLYLSEELGMARTYSRWYRLGSKGPAGNRSDTL